MFDNIVFALLGGFIDFAIVTCLLLSYFFISVFLVTLCGCIVKYDNKLYATDCINLNVSQ